MRSPRGQIRERKGLEPEPQGPRLSAVRKMRMSRPANQERRSGFKRGEGFLEEKGAMCSNQMRPSETTCLSKGPVAQFQGGAAGMEANMSGTVSVVLSFKSLFPKGAGSNGAIGGGKMWNPRALPFEAGAGEPI